MKNQPVMRTAMADAFAKALRNYIRQLDGEQPCRLYDMAMSAVEEELFRFAINHCGGNRSKAAKMLGISRTTLARKTGNGKAENGDNKTAKTAKPANKAAANKQQPAAAAAKAKAAAAKAKGAKR